MEGRSGLMPVYIEGSARRTPDGSGWGVGGGEKEAQRMLARFCRP
jgi:hypothetical protein